MVELSAFKLVIFSLAFNAVSCDIKRQSATERKVGYFQIIKVFLKSRYVSVVLVSRLVSNPGINRCGSSYFIFIEEYAHLTNPQLDYGTNIQI